MARERGRDGRSVKKKRPSATHFAVDDTVPLNVQDAEDIDHAPAGPSCQPQSVANPRDLEQAPDPERRIRMCYPKRNDSHSRWSDPESDDGLPFEVASKKRPGRPSKKKKNPFPRATPLSGRSDRLSYRLLGIGKEQPDPKLPNSIRTNIYGVAFNNFVGEAADIFATCGDTNITVYRCGRDLPGGFQAIVTYNVENESFYSCDWSRDMNKENTSFLIAAGLTGHIRVLTLGSDGQKQQVLGAHPGPVNDVKVCFNDPELLATGSGDYSVRLWNLKTFVLIAIFGGGGPEGPQNEVVSISFHDRHPLIAATGIDHSIHFWNYGTEHMVKALERATNFDVNVEHRYQFKPVIQHIPHWATRDIHSNYIDCISWWGDWVITRSVDQHIVMWRAGREGDKLMELKYTFEPEHISSTESTDNSVEDEEVAVAPSSVNQPGTSKSAKSRTAASVASKNVPAKATTSRTSKESTFADKASTVCRASLPAKASQVSVVAELFGETKSTTVAAAFKSSRRTTTSKIPVNVGASTSKGTPKNPKPNSKKATASFAYNTSKSTTTTTTIKEEPNQSSEDELEIKNTKKRMVRANYGPDVRIAKRFPIENSQSWYMRFGIDFDCRLLGFGNELGEYYLFDLGNKDDLKSGWDFKKITEFKIPMHSIVKGNYVRQVAFNYTSQLMVAVTDQCYVLLYRIKKKTKKAPPEEGGQTSEPTAAPSGLIPPSSLIIGRRPFRQPSTSSSAQSSDSQFASQGLPPHNEIFDPPADVPTEPNSK